MASLEYNETLNAPRGALILSSGSYLIEDENWYQIVSPSRKEASRNEVIFSKVDPGSELEIIQKVKNQYRELGTSFKWCIGPTSEPEGFGVFLEKEGFYYWKARGMYSLASEIHLPNQSGLVIKNVTYENKEDYLNLFIKGWELDPCSKNNLREDLDWALKVSDKRFCYFIAYYKDVPVGTAGVVLKENSAYLTGGNILQEFRGKGFYKGLIKKRVTFVQKHGIELLTTGAREKTSAPILENIGFKTAFQSEIFQFDF